MLLTEVENLRHRQAHPVRASIMISPTKGQPRPSVMVSHPTPV